jgi:hypothetical protein
MTKPLRRKMHFVICHGAPAPVIERSEVMFNPPRASPLRPAGQSADDQPADF